MIKQQTEAYWSRSEACIWTLFLTLGTTVLYAVRTAMPLCSIHISHDLDLDKTQSGLLLSTFFWGYSATQFLGGYLSDRLGGDRVIFFTTLGWSIATALIPQVVLAFRGDSYTTLNFVILLRVFTGAFQGFFYPGFSSFMANHLNKTDRSFVFSVINSGAQVGTLLMGSLGSLLLESAGWCSVFYCACAASLIWVFVLRVFFVSKKEEKIQNRIIVRQLFYTDDSLERQYYENRINRLSKDRATSSKKSAENVPWSKLFSSMAFWSLLFAHFCDNNAFFILLSWLPTYFHENFPGANAWVFNVVPWVVNIPVSLIVGFVSDKLIRSGVSITFIRKFNECVSLLGVASFLTLLTTTSSYEAALFCMTSSITCMAFHSSGALVNPQDIAQNHAGAVFGLMNMAGSIPGFLGVYMAGHILETTGSWDSVFRQTAALCVIGGVVYVMFGTGRRVL